MQTAIASRITLLQGSVDLVLLAVIAWAIQPRVTDALIWGLVGALMISLTTALPLVVPLLGYMTSTIITLLLRQRVWQVPILAMLVAVVFGTLLTQGAAWVTLSLNGVPLPAFQSFYLVLLPSLVLNLLLAVPFYILAGDIAGWLYPQELEI